MRLLLRASLAGAGRDAADKAVCELLTPGVARRASAGRRRLAELQSPGGGGQGGHQMSREPRASPWCGKRGLPLGGSYKGLGACHPGGCRPLMLAVGGQGTPPPLWKVLYDLQSPSTYQLKALTGNWWLLCWNHRDSTQNFLDGPLRIGSGLARSPASLRAWQDIGTEGKSHQLPVGVEESGTFLSQERRTRSWCSTPSPEAGIIPHVASAPSTFHLMESFSCTCLFFDVG